IRDYESQGPIPWFQLVKRYREPEDRLKQIHQQAIQDAQNARELSKRVTEAAKGHYDDVKGRIDWSAVSRQVGLPLIECLKRFDGASSGIKRRSFPTHDDWTKNEAEVLQGFVRKHFRNPTTRDWELVGNYMNVDKVDCLKRCQIMRKFEMTDERFSEITRYREAGLTWKQIRTKFGDLWAAETIGQSYRERVHRLNRSPVDIVDRFTSDELAELREVRLQQPGNITAKEFVRIAQEAFPHKSRVSVEDACTRAMAFLRLSIKISIHGFNRLQQLVRQHGEDWDLIGREMHALPSKMRNAWKGYGLDTRITTEWTADELATLRRCKDSCIPPGKTARIIGTKLPVQCRAMLSKLRRLGT
ncbi:hypothetical protein EC988_004398, partial [Linderina pennispora]